MRARSLAVALVLVACGPSPATTDASGTTDGPTTEPGPTSGPGPGPGGPSTDGEPDPTGELPTTTAGIPDLPSGPPIPDCEARGSCHMLDVLVIVDNSASMATVQRDLADDLPALIDRLRAMKDRDGAAIEPDVNIMFTTTDHGHPICAPFEKPDYVPARGAPINTACTDRLTRFDPISVLDLPVPEACTDHCSPDAAAAPTDPFIHFDPAGHNIVDLDGQGDPVADALACLLPQGIDGCGMEQPLEVLHSALAADAPWNQGAAPFLRDGAAVAIVVISDESDCSTLDVEFFDSTNQNDPEITKFWEADPNGGGKQPTSAVCWNGGVTCEDADGDTVYEHCDPEDNGVLHPLSRYKEFLLDDLELVRGKPVFMLSLIGVPSVTAHAPVPPHVPTAGGLTELVFRQWRPDDLPVDSLKSAAQLEFDFGIGPGCGDPNLGHALPSPRVSSVCHSLDRPDDPATPLDDARLRCCVESLCDADRTGAIECLVSALEREMRPAD